MPAARLGEIELHYERRGRGPALLLIAGIPAIADDWAPLAEPLSASRSVIAFDNRGSGRSTVTPGPYSTRLLAADAVALLDELGVARADVFGMSLGGMIAQELALGWPERVTTWATCRTRWATGPRSTPCSVTTRSTGCPRSSARHWS